MREICYRTNSHERTIPTRSFSISRRTSNLYAPTIGLKMITAIFRFPGSNDRKDKLIFKGTVVRITPYRDIQRHVSRRQLSKLFDVGRILRARLRLSNKYWWRRLSPTPENEMKYEEGNSELDWIHHKSYVPRTLNPFADTEEGTNGPGLAGLKRPSDDLHRFLLSSSRSCKSSGCPFRLKLNSGSSSTITLRLRLNYPTVRL